MQKRTIEDLHDKDYGHKGMARFVDLAMDNGHKVTNIREYYEKFKFNFDGYPMEFDKMPGLSVKWQLEQCELLLDYHKKIEEARQK